MRDRRAERLGDRESRAERERERGHAREERRERTCKRREKREKPEKGGEAAWTRREERGGISERKEAGRKTDQ